MAFCIEKCFAESSFHGLKYIFQRGLQITEKFFWFLLVSCAVYCAVNLSLAEWRRHIYNPTVHVVEINHQNWRFPNVGITICPNYTDNNRNEELLLKFWNVTKRDTNFNTYLDFLSALSKVTFESMGSLEPFSKYEVLNNADFLTLTREMKTTFNFKNEDHFAAVITEKGICFTNSQLNEFQNSYGILKHTNITIPPACHFYEECKIDVFPPPGTVGSLYIHELHEVMTFHGKRAKSFELNETSSGTITFILTEFISYREVRDLGVDIRQCYFSDEGISPYFAIYTPSLCRINCRTRAALKACGCRPFLYIIGDGPVCNISGMLCLSKTTWFNASCNCWNLCKKLQYTFVSKRPNGFSEFGSSLSVVTQLRNMRISRRVVFSLDQFIVSVGGGASFFLGCSFLSFVEIIYFVIEFIGEKFKLFFGRGTQ